MPITNGQVVERLNALYLKGKTDYNLKLKRKENTKWCRVIGRITDPFLKLFTHDKRKGFMDRATTIGNTVYFPTGWTYGANPEYDFVTLRHELTHVRQFAWLNPFGLLPIGVVLSLVFYLLLPLPIGLAWFRYVMERRAFLETMRARIELGKPIDIEYYVELMAGPMYGFAWPFKHAVRGWFFEHIRPYQVIQPGSSKT